MEAIMKSDGSKMQNFIVNNEGAIERPQHNVNGILICYIDALDSEGNSYLRPVISTLCKDSYLSELLSQEARHLMRQIRTIMPPL